MQIELNRRPTLYLAITIFILAISSAIADETFQEYLIRTTQVPSGKYIQFTFKASSKNRPLSISIEQTAGKRHELISLHDLTTDFAANNYHIVVAIGPKKLPDFIFGGKVQGCVIGICVGSDKGGAWRVRSSESFIKSESQAIEFDGAVDGSKPIVIKISDCSFIVNIREVANRNAN